MNAIRRFELMVKNSKTKNRETVSMSVDDAEKLLEEITLIQKQAINSQSEPDQTFIELDGGQF